MCPAGSPWTRRDQPATHTHASPFVANTAGGEKIGDHFNVSTRAPHTVFDIRRVLDRSAVFRCRSFYATRKCRLGRRVARQMCPAGFPGLGADQLATHTHASLFVATTAGGEKLLNDVQCALKRAPRRRRAECALRGSPGLGADQLITQHTRVAICNDHGG